MSRVPLSFCLLPVSSDCELWPFYQPESHKSGLIPYSLIHSGNTRHKIPLMNSNSENNVPLNAVGVEGDIDVEKH